MLVRRPHYIMSSLHNACKESSLHNTCKVTSLHNACKEISLHNACKESLHVSSQFNYILQLMAVGSESILDMLQDAIHIHVQTHTHTYTHIHTHTLTHDRITIWNQLIREQPNERFET